jgi:hypothetical protein
MLTKQEFIFTARTPVFNIAGVQAANRKEL